MSQRTMGSSDSRLVLALVLIGWVAYPALGDSARSSSRVGYRSHGHYARPQPPSQPVRQQPAGSFSGFRGMGVFGGGHQGAQAPSTRGGYPIQRPYFSTTSPFAADPNYPGGIAPRHPGGLPGRTLVYFGNPFPYTERVVYVPVAAEPDRDGYRERQAPAQGGDSSSGNAPIYIVVQPGTEVAVSPRSQAPIQLEPARERVERESPKRPKAPGELLLNILPADAEVFLDDRFLGTGADLGAVGREVASGVHVIEVTHPDHRTERLFFGVPEGGGAVLDVDLADTRSRRRSHLETTQ